MNRYRNNIFFSIVIICLYLLIWVWQGLDFLDYGYWLSAYQQFFNYPVGIGVAAMASWGTLAIGHIWQSVFGSAGLISFKLAYIVVIVVAFLVTYHVLKNNYSNDKSVLLSLIFVAFLFITKKTGIIGYNNLTALFYLLGGVLVFHSLKTQNKLIMFFAGMILGINVFIRIPNILGVLLITVIGLQAYVERWQVRKVLNFSIVFVAGFSLAIIFVLLFMQYIGHLIYYLDSLKDIFGLKDVIASENTTLGLLVFFLFRDYALSFFSGAVCILTAIVFAKKITYILFKIKWLIIFILSIVSVPILGFNHIGDWLIPGIINIVLLTLLFFQIKSKDKLTGLTYISLAIMALVPLGSGNGMWNAVFGMWLALPVTLITLYNMEDMTFKGISIKKMEIKTIYQTLITVVLVYSLVTVFTHTYHDNKNRFQMTHSVEHPLLQNIYTTKERSIVVQELLDELVKYVKPNDYLLAYNNIPMIHYLTNTRPLLGGSWPMLDSAVKIQNLLDRRTLEIGDYPLIVRSLGNSSDKNWPGSRSLAGYSSHSSKKSRELFDDFILKHHYSSVWKNSFFEILSNNL